MTYLSSGGKVGDRILAVRLHPITYGAMTNFWQEVNCDKCKFGTIFAIGSFSESSVGKTLAFTSIKFSNPNGDLVARGSHTKYVQSLVCGLEFADWPRYVSQAWKDPKNIVEELNSS